MTHRTGIAMKAALRACWKHGWLAGYLLLLVMVLVATRSKHISLESVPPRVMVQPAEEIPAPLPQPVVALRYAGVGSCAASGCHGGRRVGQAATSALSQKEYLIWVSQDPHARAFSTLFSARSQTMILQLDVKFREAVEKATGTNKAHYSFELPPGTPLERVYYAALDRQHCIDCHGTRGTSDKVSQHTLWSDGVSCESCHGPAEKWLAEHHQLNADGIRHAAGFSARQKAEHRALQGMTDLEDVSLRAQTCAKCHVGSADGDVNHDLIAAGHPQLQFEFSDYMRRMQKFAHWTRPQDRAWSQEDSLARDWAVGQAETTRAALLLRAHRLSGQDENHSGVWPEFAEMDCRSCHHQLRDETWRGERAAREGLFLPNRWYESIFANHASPVEQLAGRQSSRGAIATDLTTMQKPLQNWHVDLSTRRTVGRQCVQTAALLAELSGQLRDTSYTTANCQALLHSLAGGEPTTWAEAAQCYNALAALRGHSAQPTAMRDELRQLYDALTADHGRQMKFDREEIKQRFDALQTLVEPGLP